MRSQAGLTVTLPGRIIPRPRAYETTPDVSTCVPVGVGVGGKIRRTAGKWERHGVGVGVEVTVAVGSGFGVRVGTVCAADVWLGVAQAWVPPPSTRSAA